MRNSFKIINIRQKKQELITKCLQLNSFSFRQLRLIGSFSKIESLHQDILLLHLTQEESDQYIPLLYNIPAILKKKKQQIVKQLLNVLSRFTSFFVY